MEIIKDAINYICPSEIDIVIYHKNCHDGSSAALAAWLFLKKIKREEDVIYIPADYNMFDNFNKSLY